MGKFKYREVKQLAQGYTTSNCLELGFESRLPHSRDHILNHYHKNYVNDWALLEGS